ncbi:hypothetical protein ACWGE0_43770 [Lentzea sp. NPDC054927]
MPPKYRQLFSELVRCPACGEDLGVRPAWNEDGSPRKPSLRLRLHGQEAGRQEWQLSLFDGRVMRASAGFRPAKTTRAYRICGDGHAFVENVQAAGQMTQQSRVDDYDVVAAIGSVAAGKSYLMLRTISQYLGDNGLSTPDPGMPPPEWMSVHAPDWLLEDEPLNLLRRHYQRTHGEGFTMAPTFLRDMTPFEFLPQRVAAEIVEQILEVHRDLVGTDHVDEENWGQQIRQPIVRRYQIGDRVVLSGVADLPGEMFTSRDGGNRIFLLRHYGTLAWVIDPVICPEFTRFLDADPNGTVVPASMRPDTAISNPRKAQSDRNAVQHDLARSLTELGGIADHVGRMQYLLVCVSKSDLIRHALRHTSGLHSLGVQNNVVDGVARYLLEVTKRVGGHGLGLKLESAAMISVIGPLAEQRHSPSLRTKVAFQFAAAIVEHYSDEKNFWRLVHEGQSERIVVPEGTPNSVLPERLITVPALNDHVTASLVPGQSAVLRTRDLIMSALGCGIAYGLGFGPKINVLLNQTWRELRFFLCSPLGEVPVTVATTDNLITPLDRHAHFHEAETTSAALSQLLLCMLRRVRS